MHLKPWRGALSPYRRHPGPLAGGECPQAPWQRVRELGHYHDLLRSSVCHRNHLPAPESAPSHTQPDPHQTKSWHWPGPRGREEPRARGLEERSRWRPVSLPSSSGAGTQEPSCFTDSFSFQLSWVITGAWARGAVGYVLVPTPRTCECVGPYLGIGSLLMQEGLRGSRPGKASHPADRGGPVTEMESRPFHSHSLQGGDPLTEPGKPEGLSREGEQALR